MRSLLAIARLASLVALAVLSTCLLVYTAPGYFTDAREMDASHSQTVHLELQGLHEQQDSAAHMLRSQLSGWAHGDLGTSRQYGSPVRSLIVERCVVSARLLLLGIALGWSSALLLAAPLGMRRSTHMELAIALGTAILLALPVGLLATLSLVAGHGGPVFVLALLIAVRDFKLLFRVAQVSWKAPSILYARAQGLPATTILKTHIVATMRADLLAMAILSFTLALSALVPVEVIFDCPGLGQLAWSAAMNRDLPVLSAVTAVMAACIGVASGLGTRRGTGNTVCA